MADVALVDVLGVLAGLLILGVGAFVLRAKPDSALHRLFFALAVADGVSSAAFALSFAPLAEPVRIAAFYVYYYAFIAFIGLLFLFGLRFPRPALRGSPRRIGGVLLVGVIFGAWAIHTIDPTAFWVIGRRGGVLNFETVAGGRVVNAFYYGVTAFIVWRIVYLTLREQSPSHRRQGALVLSGMALAYGADAGRAVVVAMQRGWSASFVGGSADRLLVYWAALATLLAMAVAAVILARDQRPDHRVERRIILSCLSGAIFLTIMGVVFPLADVTNLLLIVALVAYPVLLMYAILRYEVLDIDAKLRRTAAISLIGAAFTTSFFVFEVIIENLIQDYFQSQTTIGIAAILVAALITAVISAPLGKLVKKVTDRFVPTPAPDAIEPRKREIYRHALETAASDGVIEKHELLVLKSLRETLAISMDDHDAMVREIASRAG